MNDVIVKKVLLVGVLKDTFTKDDTGEVFDYSKLFFGYASQKENYSGLVIETCSLKPKYFTKIKEFVNKEVTLEFEMRKINKTDYRPILVKFNDFVVS